MFAKYKGSRYAPKKSRVWHVRAALLSVVLLVLFVWFVSIFRLLSSNDQHPIQDRIKNSQKISKQGPELTYQEWLRRRQNITLQPLEAIKKVNVSALGKWVFRKTKDGRPHYLNLKTKEIKWITPPKNLQAYIDEEKRKTDVEGGGVLSLMDGLLKLRVDTDKKQNGENDDDDEDEDEDSTKNKDGTYKPLRPESADDDNPDSGGWVYSPRQKKLDEEKKKRAVKGKKDEGAAKAKEKILEEDKKYKEKVDKENGKKDKLVPDHIHARKGETAKSIVAEYLAKLKENHVNYNEAPPRHHN